MATINLGAIKFNWKGPYNNSTAYVVDDVVSSGGSSYVCILASQGNAVSSGTYWQIMSSAGTNGTNGTDVGTTLTTQGDILYRDGSGLQRLSIGSANQTLQVNSGATAPNWTTVAAASAVAGTKAFYAYHNANGAAMGSGANSELVFNAEMHDTESVYNVSNGRYTPGVAGLYYVFSNITVNDINGATDDLYLKFFVNGNANGHQYGGNRTSGGGQQFNAFCSSAIIPIGASDYISAYVYQDAGGNRVPQGEYSSFIGYRLT